MTLLGSNISEKHRQTIFITYLVLGGVFLGMIIINLYAYLTFVKINSFYSRLEKAVINFKLEATNANLLFREILSETSSKDMNDIWQGIRRANECADSISAVDQEKVLQKRIEDYRQMIIRAQQALKNNKRVTEIENSVADKKIKEELLVEEQLEKVDLEALWDEYQETYKLVLQHSDKIEQELNAQVESKMRTVKTLYITLIILMVLVLGFTTYSLHSYIRSRRQAEEMLLTTRGMLNTILNSLNSIVVTITAEGRILEWNKAAEKYFGYSEESAKGQFFWELVPYLARFQGEAEKIFYSKQSCEFYRERVEIAETERCLNIVMTYTAGISGVIIRIDDVTSHEIRDQHLRRVQKMQLMQSLISGLANDFNNVLGSITGTITLMRYSLENQEAGVEDVRKNIGVIESSTERAAVMVQEMMSLYTEQEIKMVPIDLNEIVRHVMQLCRNTLDTRISFQVELAKGRSIISGDAKLVEQVLLNLCDNATQAITALLETDANAEANLTLRMEHMFPGANFRAKQPKATQNSYWIVHVIDTGTGMSEETMVNAFEPFFTTQPEGESKGLGLSVVNDIVERLHGFVEVRSKPDEGSAFSVYLPEAVDKEAFFEQEAAVAEAAESVADEIPLGSGMVMVVDDEEVMQKTAGAILEKLGYEVIYASGGEEAVKLYQDNTDKNLVVLLDLMMPEMDGKATYLELKKVNSNVKVLLASGFVQDDQVEDLLKLGMDGFIKKPFSISHLAQEVDRINRLRG